MKYGDHVLWGLSFVSNPNMGPKVFKSPLFKPFFSIEIAVSSLELRDY